MVRLGVLPVIVIAFAAQIAPMLARADGEVPVPAGSWGGDHIHIMVTELGASIEFDCASARIDQRWVSDLHGHFHTKGTFARERGGPRQIGELSASAIAAEFRGWTDGENMRITVTFTHGKREMGPFSLRLGQRPRLEKCL